MSVYRLPILTFATSPDGSGNLWPEPLDVSTTNQLWKHIIWRFKNAGSAKIILSGSFSVPKNYVSAPVIVAHWSASVTTGNVAWGFDYRTVAGDDANSLDQTGTTESLSVTDAAPGAAWRRLVPTMSATAANFAADSTVQFAFYRDKSSGSDTMVGDARLVGLFFQYADV